MDIKLHIYSGLGNIIAIADGVKSNLEISSELVEHIYNSLKLNFDQLILLLPPENPQDDLSALIFNNDGSLASNCINGARCVAKYIKDNSLLFSKNYKVNTDGGLWDLEHINEDIFSVSFSVKGEINKKTVELDQKEFSLHCVDIGNLHGVTFEVSKLKALFKDINFIELGEKLQKNVYFPDGVNFGAAEKVNEKEINLRVYERGAGETLACGSGACAAAVVGIIQEEMQSPVKVNFKLGSLLVDYNRENETITAKGSAEFIEEKEIIIDG